MQQGSPPGTAQVGTSGDQNQEPQSVLDRNSLGSNVGFHSSPDTSSSVGYQQMGKAVHANHCQTNVCIIDFNNQTQLETAIE